MVYSYALEGGRSRGNGAAAPPVLVLPMRSRQLPTKLNPQQIPVAGRFFALRPASPSALLCRRARASGAAKQAGSGLSYRGMDAYMQRSMGVHS